ncbi:hypothetical protein [Salipiger mucosus]|uniref:Lysozyme inhibitor LprI N-terminal domain-containing protein n=1 Tax=Salipiger mucosus DSM 16094 TaxID=1123237 RepID=S9S2N0_9RHOB|nr:hypothetical protein [Salipiger mucosus]EPX80444.1 hypothetical protein Salmuc_03760 [Salipiger mucosus DSM 16094]
MSGRWHIGALSSALLLVAPLSSEAVADPEPLPAFATCMNIEIARYERALKRLREGPEDGFEIGETYGTEFCGTVGIVRCDRSEAPLPCQHALAETQDEMTAEVMATLPEPAEVAGRDGTESDALYPALWALARDRSAGDDCAGSTEVMEAWCEAREANRRLGSAVLAWQMARFLGAAPRATEAGWAQKPPPLRPMARPGSTGDTR